VRASSASVNPRHVNTTTTPRKASHACASRGRDEIEKSKNKIEEKGRGGAPCLRVWLTFFVGDADLGSRWVESLTGLWLASQAKHILSIAWHGDDSEPRDRIESIGVAATHDPAGVSVMHTRCSTGLELDAKVQVCE
jgi:hypothetical protein